MNFDISKIVSISADMETDIGNNLTDENEIVNNSITKRTRTQRRGVPITLEKIGRIIKILLKLAKINEYNLVERIRYKNCSFINDSDLLALIYDAMSHWHPVQFNVCELHLLENCSMVKPIIVGNIRTNLLRQVEIPKGTEFGDDLEKLRNYKQSWRG